MTHAQSSKSAKVLDMFKSEVTAMPTTESTNIRELVKDRYSALARCDVESHQEATREVAAAFGYSPEELASIPAEANLGVSCGNPTALASLKPGEVVVDLGSGAGLDVFLAAPKVGSTGRAIGIDMTADMIDRARKNAAKAGLSNVEFHLADITAMPLPDNSADCVISNCVLNLVPDKHKAFAEIFRILKPGGRLAVSDMALKQPLPEVLAKDFYPYIGCVAGAILIDDYRAGLEAAGFRSVQIVDSGLDLTAYTKMGDQMCCGSATADSDLFQRFSELLRRYDINQYAAAVKVIAVKPRECSIS
jgi:SAM-dependent methyltransferase